MGSTPRLLRRALVAVGAASLAGLLAACSNGGSSAIPQTTAQSQGRAVPFAPKIHRVLHISKASIAHVMHKLVRAGAYYSPVKGKKPRLIHLRHPNTVSAGMNLTYNGGPVQTGSNEYNILVNCNDESCWGGKISQFQNDLFGGSMMSILSQYNASGTYSSAGDYPVTYDTSNQLSDQDIYNIVYSVVTANNLPTGYGAEYHVFLQSGVQQCSQSAGGCYGQQYCAYHGSNDWSDIGHVLYSVEPYQDIQGCQESDGASSPNGSLVDSTASTLSHETFETMTDPDVGVNNVAWYNQQGGEIGDLCAPAAGVPTGVVTWNASWDIQMEYDNNISDCSYTL